MRRWRSRIIAFTFGFKVSLIAVFLYSLIAGLFMPAPRRTALTVPTPQSPCQAKSYFTSPEAIRDALTSDDVGVRREMFRRLFLRPDVMTIYYDYERDREYPERAANVDVRYVHLDDDRAPTVVRVPEVVLTFVRFEHPVALVLQRDTCGWRLCAALSAWLRAEDYPYQNWLELPELLKPGTHELLLHESTSDASVYVRKARVLKLINGTLTQIAEFNEEEVRPVPDYHGADWSDVKQRSLTRYAVLNGGSAPRLQLTTTGALIKYSGVAPIYWYETDGAWHALARHWRTRRAVRLKALDEHVVNFVWDEQRRRFIESGK
jgi:hypothetical protein